MRNQTASENVAMVKKTTAPRNLEKLLKINLLSGAREEDLRGIGRVIRNGRQLIVCEMIVYGRRRRKVALAMGTYARLDQSWR